MEKKKKSRKYTLKELKIGLLVSGALRASRTHASPLHTKTSFKKRLTGMSSIIPNRIHPVKNKSLQKNIVRNINKYGTSYRTGKATFSPGSQIGSSSDQVQAAPETFRTVRKR